MGLNINSNCYSESFLFHNLVHILQHLNNLRHNDYLFYDFLKNVRNFNQLLFVRNNSNRDIDDTINNLKDFFDMIDIANCFFEFLEYYSFLYYSLDLFYCFVLIA